MTDAGHIPVLAEHVMRLLDPQPGRTYLDCTTGRGGHALMIAECLGPTGRILGLDADPANVAFARERLSETPPRCDIVHANFTLARQTLDELDTPHADLLLADLGFASNQMDDPERGFSFQADGPLDMRLDTSRGDTAADLVNRLPEKELADLIYTYGEERFSRRIARKIVETRKQAPIRSTAELAQTVRAATGHRPRTKSRGGRVHKGSRAPIDPATRTFMALRIAVNAELDALQSLLDSLPLLLSPQGVAAVISFHSLEDRLVKRAFHQMERDGLGKRLTKKPIVADDAERQANPRSRSAKLRGFRFSREE